MNNTKPGHRPGVLDFYGFDTWGVTPRMENVNRYFWQSRAGLRDPPELTDLRSLATAVRKATEAQAYAREQSQERGN